MNTHATYPPTERPQPRHDPYPVDVPRRPSLGAEAAPLVVTILGAVALLVIGAPPA